MPPTLLNTATMMGPQQSQEPGRKVKNGPHWLDRYATPFHDWTSSHTGGRTTYQRPLGLVELSFDADGVHYGGRADMTATLTLALSHCLSPTEFRHRIAAAWTALRLRHVLLMSRCIESTDSSSSSFPGALRRFNVDLPGSEEEAVQETLQSGIVWVEDFYGVGEVDPRTLHDHALNVGRIVDPAICLSKLLVLPVRQKEDGTSELSLLVIMGHQISDGLSAYSWFSDLIRLLNLSPSTLSTEIHSALEPSIFSTRLPPAQESLYPAVKGSRARQRWIWAILRVLRHVQHTLPPSFSNPLYRSTRLKTARPLPQTYPKLFSYSPASLPPNSTAHINATLSPTASARMQALCRSASLSIGAGCFALAGLAMMDIHSALSPSSSPPAMTASFPLNPRSFFAPSPSPDSCMLSFSDGIVLGHTSRSLPITSRFLLTARLANRELRAYQKRGRQTSLNAGGAAAFDRHAPARLLATGYLAQIERVVARGSETAKQLGFVGLPQGELEAKKGPMATCGVSSVGSLKGFFRAGEYDLDDASKDFVVDYRGVRMGVRAREGEFLIGSSTDGEGRVGFGVSYDASAIDPEKAELWARTITGLLEESKAKL